LDKPRETESLPNLVDLDKSRELQRQFQKEQLESVKKMREINRLLNNPKREPSDIVEYSPLPKNIKQRVDEVKSNLNQIKQSQNDIINFFARELFSNSEEEKTPSKTAPNRQINKSSFYRKAQEEFKHGPKNILPF
jgi:uncharacterized protein YukE